MKNNKAIEVVDLTKTFGDFTAVSKVSFDVEKGEIFGFLGANGAGKSTTIRMLCGILEPTSGRGIVAGYDILNEARSVRQNIGYMSQKFSLYDEMTVYENMFFFAKLYSVPKKKLKDRINTCVKLVKLEGFEKIKAKSLSSGVKQRLSLACSIIHEPKIIFLDEPTSGVDPISRRNFWDLIYSFSAAGVTILVTTHYMDEAEYCDRIAMITAGKLSAIGTPEELKTVKMTKEVFVIKGDKLFPMYQCLKDAKKFFDVGILADTVRVLSSGVNKEDIKQILEAKGFSGFSLDNTDASLEDVFVSLAGRSE